MQMPQHSDAAKSAFRELVAHIDAPDVVVKPMFGSVGAFCGGYMFAGLFAQDLGIKPDADTLAQVQAMPGSAPFGPPQRPMNGWVSLPPDLPTDEQVALMERALAHVRTLPPKATKTAKTTTPKTARPKPTSTRP